MADVSVDFGGPKVASGQAPETKPRKKKPTMTKHGRVAARKNLRKTMPSSKQRMHGGMDPTQNNPNDIGAVIIPQGTPSTLRES